MKKFREEFREFISRGNMMDMAVGIIIGAAFTAIVTSLVEDLINPILGIFTGHVDFSNLFVALNGQHYDSLAAAEEAGANVFKYGSFISAVINFIIIALVVFCLIKILAKFQNKVKKAEEAAPPTTKKCPYCISEISIEAKRCPQCTTILEPFDEITPESMKSE